MKHLSLVKIIAALCICNVYLFTCGVMGVAGDGNVAVTDDEPDKDKEATGQGTQDFLLPDNNLGEDRHRQFRAAVYCEAARKRGFCPGQAYGKAAERGHHKFGKLVNEQCVRY